MNTPITQDDLFAHVAGQFLSAPLPDDWKSMSQTSFLCFIEENKWEPVEDWDTDFLLDQMYTDAHSLRLFLEGKGMEILASCSKITNYEVYEKIEEHGLVTVVHAQFVSLCAMLNGYCPPDEPAFDVRQSHKREMVGYKVEVG